MRKYSFSQRTINKWNKLSTDCVTASSVNMLKNIHLPSGPLAWMANLVKSVLNLAAGPDAEEVDGAVLSTLEHLHVTTNTYK